MYIAYDMCYIGVLICLQTWSYSTQMWVFNYKIEAYKPYMSCDDL